MRVFAGMTHGEDLDMLRTTIALVNSQSDSSIWKQSRQELASAVWDTDFGENIRYPVLEIDDQFSKREWRERRSKFYKAVSSPFWSMASYLRREPKKPEPPHKLA